MPHNISNSWSLIEIPSVTGHCDKKEDATNTSFHPRPPPTWLLLLLSQTQQYWQTKWNYMVNLPQSMTCTLMAIHPLLVRCPCHPLIGIKVTQCNLLQRCVGHCSCSCAIHGQCRGALDATPGQLCCLWCMLGYCLGTFCVRSARMARQNEM